jgi:hypothetical protein
MVDVGRPSLDALQNLGQFLCLHGEKYNTIAGGCLKSDSTLERSGAISWLAMRPPCSVTMQLALDFFHRLDETEVWLLKNRPW